MVWERSAVHRLESSLLQRAIKSKARLDRAGLLVFGLPTILGSRGSLCTTLRRDRLSYFAHEEGLQVRLRTGPLQTDNRVSRLARNEIVLSVWAGNVKFAGLAL